MDHIEQIFLKLFISSDDFQYVYNEKDVRHGNVDMIRNFYSTVKQELLTTYNLDMKEVDLKELWRLKRKKFVEINLLKSRGLKVTKLKEEYYNKHIFLEDYISHKNDKVYNTSNKKEIMQKLYDKIIMNNTDDNDAQSGSEDSYINDDFPDVSSIYNLEYESVEILDEYEDIVKKNLEDEANRNVTQIIDVQKDVPSVSSIEPTKPLPLKSKFCLVPSANSPLEVLNKKELQKRVKPTKLLPLQSKLLLVPSVTSPLEVVNKKELQLGSCRGKCEQMINTNYDLIVTTIASVLNQAILERKTVTYRARILQLIVDSIKTFCEIHQN